MRTGKPTNDVIFEEMKASGIYHVDDLGRVLTKKKLGGPGAIYTDRWRRTETAPAGGGRTQLRHNGGLVYTNRFVWFWFNGPIPAGLEVDHKNSDKLDNHPDKLQVITRLENQRKAEAEAEGLIRRGGPCESRRQAAIRFWQAPGRREQMSESAKLGWEKRRG